MGHNRHHAIIVTTYDKVRGEQAHAKALELFTHAVAPFSYTNTPISPLVETKLNGYYSFCVFPDGSKEGWEESDFWDGQRAEFIAWLDSTRFGDGSSPYDWAEVQYGDGESKVTAHSDERHRDKRWEEVTGAQPPPP